MVLNNSLDTLFTSYTPVVTGSSASGSVSYTTQSGVYTQVGNLIMATFAVAGSITGVPSGDLQVSLPFTSNATANSNTCGAAICTVGGANQSPIIAQNAPSSDVVTIYSQSTGNKIAIATGNFSIRVSITYSL